MVFVDELTTSFESECLYSVEAQIVINSDDPEDQEALMAPLRELQRDICPRQCSDQGTCVNGSCICDPGIHIHSVMVYMMNIVSRLV